MYKKLMLLIHVIVKFIIGIHLTNGIDLKKKKSSDHNMY